jgi:hypothetical protein
MGAIGTRPSLRPLCFEKGESIDKLGRKPRRENANVRVRPAMLQKSRVFAGVLA